jgi:hypothetical protein
VINRNEPCPAADENVSHMAHEWTENDVPETAWCEGVTAPLTLTLRFADVNRLDMFADTAMVAYQALRDMKDDVDLELTMAQWDGFTSTLVAMVANAPGRSVNGD